MYGTVVMDLDGKVRIPRAGAVASAILRLGIGFVYLSAFVSQGFGVGYTNQVVNQSAPATTEVQYEWDFTFDADNGWISSGFQHSPTAGYIDNNTHGPLAPIVQNLPNGLVDFMWIFAIGGYWGIGRWWRGKTPALLH
jgi:thiosulfate dehydrogenase [quinone] large subunit